MLHLAALLLFPLLMIFAALSDLFTMTISNRLSLALAIAFVPLAIMAGLSGEAIAVHFACGFGVLVLTFVFFAFGWIGGGDAKLAAATAVWMGMDQLADYGLYSALLGGALTLLLLTCRNVPLPRFALNVAWLERLHDRNTGVPYGIALAAAGLMLYPETHLWSAAALA